MDVIQDGLYGPLKSNIGLLTIQYLYNIEHNQVYITCQTVTKVASFELTSKYFLHDNISVINVLHKFSFSALHNVFYMNSSIFFRNIWWHE